MVELKNEKKGSVLTVWLSGRLDTTSAPEVEDELTHLLDDITELELDLSSLEYISSAGLRVLLNIKKIMDKQGKLGFRNIPDSIFEIFTITGFSEILKIER